MIKAIVNYTKRNNIDLIVMGGGDLSKIHLVVNRSITDGVIKKVNCPVIVSSSHALKQTKIFR
ncbi:MAG TPA: universal stress protein [Nitrososphaeraceae archaeon]|nr:universal stress protein [Nitrososphaeraceae archaeon]